MSDELTIESIISTVETPEQLTDDQKNFLTDNSESLTDDQAKKYGIEKLPVIPDPPKVEDPPAPKEGDEGGDVDPEDEKKINKLFDKRLSGLTKTQQETQRKLEVDQFLSRNPNGVANVDRYRDKMVQYATHPNYQKLSPQELFNILAGPELMRIGAKKERDAAKRAKDTQVNNNSSRPAGGGGQKKDWSNASKEDFEAQKAAVLGRRGN